MAIASALITVLLLSVPPWIGAQAANQPEVISGTAQAKNATGAVSGTLEVRLRRVTPEFDRKAVETALKEGGYPRFLTAIRNAPEVGRSCCARCWRVSAAAAPSRRHAKATRWP